jgi:hypothetical protein
VKDSAQARACVWPACLPACLPVCLNVCACVCVCARVCPGAVCVCVHPCMHAVPCHVAWRACMTVRGHPPRAAETVQVRVTQLDALKENVISVLRKMGQTTKCRKPAVV